MKNNNVIYLIVIAGCLISGFLFGWQIRGCSIGGKTSVTSGKSLVQVHDTIKTKVIEYKYIPGTEYNVDSLVEVINTFWKDSLKSLYGKGMFEISFTKEDKLGKREIILESRIPIDPEAKIAIDEQLTMPEVYSKKTFGIYGGLGIDMNSSIAGVIGGKYYIMDYRNFSTTGMIEGRYSIGNKSWKPGATVEMELKF
jgi:hypothetical protein